MSALALPMSDYPQLLDVMEKAALAAGRRIMHFYDNGCAVTVKADASPVTEADQAAEQIIVAALQAAAADCLVVAEEAVAAGGIPSVGAAPFFLVDPLDGTREFIQRNGDFTVNIALVVNAKPVLGIVYAPARNLLFLGGPDGALRARTDAAHQIIEREPIHVRPLPAEPVIACSRSHDSEATRAYLATHGFNKRISIGSSLKFCLIACGEADIYPRFGPTMEWDTAAGDAILAAAGGATLGCDGRPLRYGNINGAALPFGSPDFIASGSGRLDFPPRT